MTSIAIVGAGLLGSAVADELAGAGAGVTVLEAGQPAGGTSGSSFAWVNAQDKAPADYYELNAEGVAAYPALATSLGGDWYHPGGDISIGRGAGAAKLADKIERHLALGYPVRELDCTAVLALEPGLELPADGELRAAHFSDDAWIDAPLLVERRLARATGLGAIVRAASAVTGFSRVGDRVTGVLTEAGPVTADVVLVAAGTASVAWRASLARSCRCRRPRGSWRRQKPPTCRCRTSCTPAMSRSAQMIPAGSCCHRARSTRRWTRRPVPWPRTATRATNFSPVPGDSFPRSAGCASVAFGSACGPSPPMASRSRGMLRESRASTSWSLTAARRWPRFSAGSWASELLGRDESRLAAWRPARFG